MKRGRFITFEGGEGAGKSTQAARLAARLQATGIEVVRTREPGGSQGAEALRELLVHGGADRWSPTAETLMMYAARSDHLERVIRPALAAGAWVVCDRFSDSTRAYQGAGGGVPTELIETLDKAVVLGDQPDLTLIIDVPAELGLERAQARGGEARFEGKGLAFHRRLREGFLAIARAEPDRCVVLDGAAAPDDVADRIWKAVQSQLIERSTLDE
jgi:dTMP kinase